ncbi:MAG: hypothetical protein ACR2J8_08860, partial [Thermomicrobiales bacterium]
SHVLSNVYGFSVAAGAGSVFSSISDSPTFHFGTTAYSSGYSDGALLYVPSGGPVGVGGVSLEISPQKLSRKLQKRCRNHGMAVKALVAIEGPHEFSKTMKGGACGLVKGGTVKTPVDLLDAADYPSTAERRSPHNVLYNVNLLDEGDYSVTVTVGKRSGQATFAIEPDTTKSVTVKLRRL